MCTCDTTLQVIKQRAFEDCTTSVVLLNKQEYPSDTCLELSAYTVDQGQLSAVDKISKITIIDWLSD